MKILIEGHRLARARDFGGIDAYWQRLVPELLALADPELRFVVLSAFLNPRRGAALEALQERGAILRHWWMTPECLHAMRRIGARFEWFAGAHELVHLPEPVCPLRSDGRVVVTSHDLMYLHHPQFLHPRWTARLLRGTEALAARANLWICVSEHTREDLVRHYGVARGRTVVVAHGVDESFAAAAADPAGGAAAARRLELDGRPYFLFVGSVEPKKNLPALLEAYGRALAHDGLRSSLLIAGRAAWGMAEADAALARHPALREHVRFLGFVAQQDLPFLIAGARALLLPSRYEGFGMPVLEAMAAGTPVICSDRGALPEVAGGAALLHDPDDEAGIAELLARVDADDALCENLRVRGRAHAQAFTWRRCAERTVDAYRMACALPA